MTEAKGTRLRKQRERQADYRESQKNTQRPGRDDIARVALWWLLKSLEERSRKIKSHIVMNSIIDEIVAVLVDQGFAEGASEDVIDDLVSKYSSGWRFQRKPHLRAKPGHKA